MFEFVRTHQKLLQIVLLALILPSFAFIGVESYTNMGSKDSDIAKVGKDLVTGVEFDNTLKNQAAKSGLPAEYANSSAFKSNVLDQIIQQKLLKNELQSLHLQVSDERLTKELNRFPEIQALKKPDGSIDAEKYKQLLQSNGLSVNQFQNIKRSELMSADLQNAIASNQQGINSNTVSEKLIAAYGIEREVQVVFFLADQYAKNIKVEESELKDYYQAHPSDFQTTPTADVEYVILQRDTKIDEKEFAKKADSFANIVYEQADSLQAVADSLKLTIQKASGVSASGKASLAKGHPINESKVLKTIFKEDVLKLNKNSEVVQLPNGDLISVHVTQFNESKTQNFDVVKADIEKLVRSKKAEEMAVKEGSQLVEKLQSEPNAKLPGKEFSKSVWVSRNKPLDLSGEPFEKIFGVDPTKLPQVVSAKLPGSGIALYRVTQVRETKENNPKAQIEQFKQIADLNLQNELAAYFSNMKERFPVKKLKSLQ
jgi:hypothetical protein